MTTSQSHDCSRTAPWASARAQARMASLESSLTASSAAQLTRQLEEQIRAHAHRGAVGVPLYAGTNVLSPGVSRLHDTALSTRPALGWPGEKLQPATEEIEALEVMANQQVAFSMRARFAEVRYLSATMANLAAYAAFTSPGDTIAVLSQEAGGHASHQGPEGTAGLAGLRVVHLPYDTAALDVDHASLGEFLGATRPRMIVIGGSVALFPHDVGRLRAAADSVGALVMYDASHTAGLMAANLFQEPLAEGAHLVTFSTYKTFAGPAGGAAVTDSQDIAEAMSTAAYPRLLSNYDPARLGPLALAAFEAQEQSPAWALPTVEFARALGEELSHRGLPVLGAELGWTRSHQVAVDVGRFGGGTAVTRRLAQWGVYVGPGRLPWQRHDERPAAMRLGTQELVRRGAGPSSAVAVADLIHRALLADGADDVAAVKQARERVLEHTAVDLWGRPAVRG